MLFYTATTLTILISFLNAAVIPPLPCPPGWSELANSFTCYKLVLDPKSWQGSKDFCASVLPNSGLIIIDNALELAFINSLAAGHNIWVGDENTSNGVRQCVRGVNGGQSLVLTPCADLLALVCELDISPNPCQVLPPTAPIQLYYHVHPALPYKFIQCSAQGDKFARLCAKGTIWNQLFLTCVFPPPAQRKRRFNEEPEHKFSRNNYGVDSRIYKERNEPNEQEPDSDEPYGKEKAYYDLVEYAGYPIPQPAGPRYVSYDGNVNSNDNSNDNNDDDDDDDK